MNLHVRAKRYNVVNEFHFQYIKSFFFTYTCEFGRCCNERVRVGCEDADRNDQNRTDQVVHTT